MSCFSEKCEDFGALKIGRRSRNEAGKTVVEAGIFRGALRLCL